MYRYMLKADSFEGGAGAWGPQPGGHRREQGVPEAPSRGCFGRLSSGNLTVKATENDHRNS